MTTQGMTEDQLHAFGNKLEAFGNTLLPMEQELFAEILSLAAAATEQDVTGHSIVETTSLLTNFSHIDLSAWLHATLLQFTHASHAHAAGLHSPASHALDIHTATSHIPGAGSHDVHIAASHIPADVHTPTSHIPADVHTPTSHIPADVHTSGSHTPADVHTPGGHIPE